MPSDLAEKVPSTSSDSLSWPPAGQDSLALGRLLDRIVDALPFHADALDAEIVLGPDLEAEELGVEDHLLSRQVLAGEARRLVLAAVDREGERLLARRGRQLSCQRNSILRVPLIGVVVAADRGSGGRPGLPVHLGGCSGRGWRSRRRWPDSPRPARWPRRARPSDRFFAAEVVGERHVGDDRASARAGGSARS